MDTVNRQKFWETLCSLPGRDIDAEVERLLKVIKYPHTLFRYRSVNEASLEALRTNKLYFSSANYYDDPFDTFLHIDIDAIRKEFQKGLEKPENIEAVAKGIKVMLNDVLTEQQKKDLTVESIKNILSSEFVEKILDIALSLREEVKKDTWSVCFSENGFNEVLWLKYANQHRGFVQFYCLEENENFLCGKQKECANCGMKMNRLPLYPIYYSDEPYDATNFAKFIMIRKIIEIAKLQIPEEFYSKMEKFTWERERTALIKKECHKYDEEWRMFVVSNMNSPIHVKWIPSGIILGLRMDAAEENLVISMAKEAGIKEIYKSFIDKKIF